MSSYSLERIRSRYVNLYLLHRPGEALLVDGGPAGSENLIFSEMQRLNLQPSMLRFLLLTHSHFDHSGSAAVLKETLGCRIIIHEAEAERLREGSTPFPKGTRRKAKWMVALGRLFRARITSFPPVTPDLLLSSTMELGELGFPGKILHMPGHSPGSVVILLEEGKLLCGDLLFGLKGKRHFPPFAEDVSRLWKSWKALHALEDWEVAYPAHGYPVPRASFEREFREMGPVFS